MTIGAKITELRAQHNMSQGDLAEKLNISRQSISKWETNTSIPELDKLIQLSDLFHISIDELVRDNDLQQTQEGGFADTSETPEPEQPPTPPQPQVGVQKSISTQKIIGFILLGIGLLCCVLGLIFSRVLFSLGTYILLCSILCLLLKKNAGLIITWITLILFMVIGPRIIGYRYLSVIQFVLLGLAIILTYLTLRKRTRAN